MKRIIFYLAALAAIAAIFTGCTATGNVSTDPDGMIESSTTASPSTTIAESTRGTLPEGSILPDESNVGDTTASTTAETHATQESTDASRSGKTTR